MDDLIKRQDAIRAVTTRDGCGRCEKAIKNIPFVDAVEVVRCKDCKHWVRNGNESYGYAMFCVADCSLGGQGIKKPDDFCSYGERKTDG